ncbi:uncharacterized protein LOC113290721 [Papaver somniferum]|uniref:uncharacterized protein LOC113290721 n=1 Tax=Papaver somniferum TaxID=3469 RepID=UPI000E6F6A08|nr:uncharacterized protein LOC113290721 [Papaver somniferum]
MDQKLQLLLDRSELFHDNHQEREINHTINHEVGVGFRHNHNHQVIPNHPTDEGVFPNYRPKVDFPRFDGVNLRAWICKCKKYFFLHQDYQEGKGAIYWDDFIIDVCTRFQELGHDSVVGEFNKLDQTGRVLEYQEQFEEVKALMLAKNKSLTEDYFIHSFVTGLKEYLRMVVQMFTPTTLQQVIFLARRQECIMDKYAHSQPKFTNRLSYESNTLPTSTKASTLTPLVTSPTVTSPTTSPKMPPLKKLTYAKMREKREKGLCYNCDEFYTKGHKCIKQQLYMIVAGDEEGLHSAEVGEGSIPTIMKLEEKMEISFHALDGNISHTSIKIKGRVKGHELTILVESGSTHSFLDPSVAKRCGTNILPTQTLQVTVADGNKLLSQAKCPGFTWVMQGNTLSRDLHLLELGGCDMVLGVDWMRELSPMLFDFKKLTITFQHQGKNIELVGHTEEATVSIMNVTAPSTDIAAPIAEVLDQFSSVFQLPTSLPPQRAHDHHIPLSPNSVPPNQRPYHVPFVQKSVLEKLVQEMLIDGFIQPSHSPLSSPVLLVKKKDDDWRFCVDYHKLNSMTIKDKYPIPIIDELLAELRGSKIFKLDLQSGYHQILVHPPDIQKTAFRTHHDHFEFCVMPFGLTNAPSTFQSPMNDIFKPHLRKFILVFFYDILIYSPDLTSHCTHLRIALSLLQQHSLFVKCSKCCFGQPQVEYLGHIISHAGVAIDPAKIECMLKCPRPTTLKGLRGFLGLT